MESSFLQEHCMLTIRLYLEKSASCHTPLIMSLLETPLSKQEGSNQIKGTEQNEDA